MSVKIVTKQAATESVELYRTCGNGIAIHVRTPTPDAKTFLHEKEARQLRFELDKLIAEAWPPKEYAVMTQGGAYVLTGLPNITVTLKE